MSSNCHGPSEGYRTVDIQRQSITDELSDHIYVLNDYGKETFSNQVARHEEIEKYLKKSRLYSAKSKRWVKVPKAPSREDELYEPFKKILSDILMHFQYTRKRSVEDKHAKDVAHVEGDFGGGKPLATKPDFMFQSLSQYSAIPCNPQSREKYQNLYKACVSFGDLKTQKNYNAKQAPIQLGVYARQCFIQQGNRMFVYSVIITEEWIRLYVFDRKGVMQSKSHYHIHYDAVSFVRIILGVSQKDERLVGFDTNVFWSGDDRFVKVNGIDYKLTTHNTIAEPSELRDPYFQRRAIVGRGTTCWTAEDKDGQLVLIKDYWRAADRAPEWELLEKVKGVKGVAQIIDHEDGPKISTNRGIKPDLDHWSDRIFGRLVLKYHGKSIECFETREEILYAFRDAIAGHRRLWKRNILHRDVSTNNVLIGPPDSEKGWLGVLIDLDLAIFIDRTSSLAEVDFRTGTRAFQSLSVLASYIRDRRSIPHDYLDDLESFYYVLCWICCGYSKPGKKVSPFPSAFTQWESSNPEIAEDAKTSFLAYEFSDGKKLRVTEYFGEIFQKLLGSLHNFFRQIIGRKEKNFREGHCMTLMDLKPNSDSDYEKILNFVDKAIEELKNPPRPPENRTLPVPVIQPPFAHSFGICIPLSRSDEGSPVRYQNTGGEEVETRRYRHRSEITTSESPEGSPSFPRKRPSGTGHDSESPSAKRIKKSALENYGRDSGPLSISRRMSADAGLKPLNGDSLSARGSRVKKGASTNSRMKTSGNDSEVKPRRSSTRLAAANNSAGPSSSVNSRQKSMSRRR